MRRLIPFLFGVLFLLRIQDDGSIIDETWGNPVYHPSLSKWVLTNQRGVLGFDIKDAYLSADGKTLVVLVEPNSVMLRKK